jgi:hypothetical protein
VNAAAAAAANAQLARRRVKQALGAIKKASKLLAQVDSGFDAIASHTVAGEEDIEGLVELTRAALAERGAEVEVVLLGSLTAPTIQPPHGPHDGAKEKSHAP